VSEGEFVKLECGPETIRALAGKLDRFGALEAAPGLFVSAVWLCAGRADFLASSSTKVLPDGYIARPLAIHRADEFQQQLESELADISGRLVALQAGEQLPEPRMPVRPSTLQSFGGGRFSTRIVIRLCRRGSATHRVACGLMFEFETGKLLVGTDIGTLAMVVSDDEALVDRYVASCETLAATEYLSSYAG
jgi:hypothetical protein